MSYLRTPINHVQYIAYTPHITFHSTLLQWRRVPSVQPQKLAPAPLDSLHNYRSMVSVKIININAERKKGKTIAIPMIIRK